MRLFIGLGLSQPAREALWNAAAELNVQGVSVRRENIHITLAFLGERDERQAAAVQRIAAAAAVGSAPLALCAREFGFFGRRENALLYAALAPCPPLHTLAGRLRQMLSEAGEAFDEKPFAAHITLSRKADLRGVSLTNPFAPVFFTADALTVYHSVRVREELRYLPYFTAPLQEGDRV